MKINIFHRTLLALIATMTLSFAQDIRIQGRTGLGVWIKIDDNDDDPDQDVTDFGSVPFNHQLDRRYRIQNRDNNDTLTVSVNNNSPSSTSSQFTFPDFPSGSFTVPPNGDREFLIRYRPVTSSRTSIIRIDSNSGNFGSAERIYTFAVRGEGTGGIISVNYDPDTGSDVGIGNGFAASTTAGTNFGTIRAEDSLRRDFFVRNSMDSDDPLVLIDAVLGGPDADQFEVNSLSLSDIRAGNNENFNIVFEPTSEGVKNATLTIRSNDIDNSPFVVNLRGNALPPFAPEISVRGRGNNLVFREITDGSLNSPDVNNGTDFGDQDIDGGTAERVFRISNLGDETLRITSREFIGNDENEFGVSGLLNLLSTRSINVGSFHDFTIRFDPDTIGTKDVVFSMGTNDPNEDPFSFTLRGTGVGFPKARVRGLENFGIGFVPTDIDNGDLNPDQTVTQFGDVDLGDTGRRSFRLVNDGTGPLELLSVNSSNRDFSFVGLPTTVRANDNEEFDIVYTPTTLGDSTTIITLMTNDQEEAYTFALSGRGEGPEIAVFGSGGTNLYTEIVDGENNPRRTVGTAFSAGVGASSTFRFRIDNNGNSALTLNARDFIGDDEKEFSVSGLLSLGRRTIDPRESHFFEMTFEPSNVGLETVVFELRSNDHDEDPYTFTVTGEGSGESEIRVRGLDSLGIPSDIDNRDTNPDQVVTRFGLVNPGESAVRKYRILNEGTDVLEISSITSSEPEFTIAGLETSIEPGERDDFQITFSPTDAEEIETLITIRSNDPGIGDPYTFALVGSGRGPEMELRGGGANFSMVIEDGDSTPSEEDGTFFGEVNPNGGAFLEPFRISNTGTTDLVISGATITGAHPQDFTVREINGGLLNLGNLRINAGEFSDIEVLFNPTGDGNRAATINLETNDANENPYSFAVAGVGEDPDSVPQIAVTFRGVVISNGNSTPNLNDGTDFGTLTLGGESETRAFIITNDGDADLEINGLLVNNAVYLNSTPSTVPPGEDRVFDITLVPSEAGVQDGIVNIFTNDPENSAFTFGIRGNVVDEDGTVMMSRISNFSLRGNNPGLTVNVANGEILRLQMNTNLDPNNWQTVPGYSEINGSEEPIFIPLDEIMADMSEGGVPRLFFQLQEAN